MRPLFVILKEMQKSFDKNKLGDAQRAQYMKAVFGEEASSAAAVLMTGASSGKLDALTKALQESDGKTAALVEIMQNNLGGDFKEFQSAYEAVGTDLFDQQEGSLRHLVQTATKYVLKLDKWIVNNKALAGTIAKLAGGALIITGALGAIGLVIGPVIGGINAIIMAASFLWSGLTVIGGAIATVIGGLTWPIAAVGVAIVAGALLIRKYWEPISAFFKGVIEGLGVAFEPVKELFSPLKPVFDWLGDKLKAVWQWFKDLIEPVKSTQETLNGCKDAGVMFGKAIADALTAPLRAFNKLREGVDWLLQKMGLIKDESADIDKNADKARGAGRDVGAGSLATPPAGGLLGGGYVPVSAGGGRNYQDNSTHNYQIVTDGGNGRDSGREIREQLEARDRQRRAQARSQMAHD